MTPVHLFLLFAASSGRNEDSPREGNESRWRRRTAKRRQRVDALLDLIEAGGLPDLMQPKLTSKMTRGDSLVPTLQVPTSSKIKWEEVDPLLDPMQGGKIRDFERGMRKRAQVESFYYLLSVLIGAQQDSKASSKDSRITIIDAGCGAGNLVIALAGLLSSQSDNLRFLAVDVNQHALNRLEERANSVEECSKMLETCCADLGDYEYISSKIPLNHTAIVVSLHACGAASDMAMNLAFRCNKAPFIICPCCTAKSLTKRTVLPNTDETEKEYIEPFASFRRSGASFDIVYPRSKWLNSKLVQSNRIGIEEEYSILAKVADLGLGPQTSAEQRLTQRRAKKIVEFDRLLSASDNEGYSVRLMRVMGHDPLVYSKGDLLVGAEQGTVGANVLWINQMQHKRITAAIDGLGRMIQRISAMGRGISAEHVNKQDFSVDNFDSFVI
ncbi:hypothetical protein HJC23_003109 [Cyclotella cryptica]|uniref:Methyltransferase domain-containing protein n=1 Tax=Cyclotella cryptica TaxID=29204 RepID=A0ABD3NZV1_9STRA